MDNIEEKINKIYKNRKLENLIMDYVETDNQILKLELLEIIKNLMIELNI